MIQIIKTTDLLKAKPINEQLLKFGRNEVNVQIAKYVNKCLSGLDIEMSNDQIQIFIEDIVDVYRWDSIEDIQICLKNGRQGKYGKTYNKLNMIIFQDWMSQHLEQKSIERENQHNKQKHDFKTREEYENAVKIGTENRKQSDQLKKPIADFNNFKMKYESKKGKESTEGTIKPDK